MRRTMQAPLDEWLTRLSASDRRVHLALAVEMDAISPALQGLIRAIACEIGADMMREHAMLKRIEDERRAELDDIAERAVWPKGTPTWAEVSGPREDDPDDQSA